ncbi:nucleotidyltransferase family protein [Lentibacillus sp. CBA3610]|uniref:nucleotidyltransferase family protein n=1 Tax=Lentibacillus sp. CBA3610 TaxID=2518176 RepID=UPI001595A655|nr:nucleotidyltransferase family protein [Lentibacillus sp. CBA3610]QKY69379.1 nucleotidyltransferase family protein [Lentibacillus sp. CBA3610]
MNLKNERDILNLISEDDWMMEILATVKSLNLPDWWICAGFIRSKIWDTLHGFRERTRVPDIDVIYFDNTNTDEVTEKRLEQKLIKIHPKEPWSVKNEARMHIANDIEPYSSSVDAISKFPETATALGVKLDKYDNLILAAPYGVEDVINLEVKPTSYFINSRGRISIYEERMVKKNWISKWNKIRIKHMKNMLD